MALRFGPRSFPLDHHLLVNLPSVRLCRFYSVFRLIRPFSTSSTSPPFSRDNSLHGPESKKLEEKPSHNESITSSTSTEENTSSSPPPFSFEDDDPIRVVESKIIHPSPSPQTTPTSPRQIPELQIVFEDFDFFFVHKPHDWAVSGVGKEKEQQGDQNFHVSIRHHAEKKYHYRSSILHRLDRVCSGIMVYGKNKEAEKYFQRMLMNEHDRMNKVYFAIVHKSPPHTMGVVEGGIIKSAANRTRFSIVRKGGSPVRTEYRVLQKFTHSSLGDLSLLAMRLVTGKQHQARATASSLGCPIVGDIRYGGKKFPRVLLHSAFVGFPARVGSPYAVRLAPTWDSIDSSLPTCNEYLSLLRSPEQKPIEKRK